MPPTYILAVVTGSSRGIGRAIAERLARDGAHVVVTDVRDGSATVETIEAAGGSAEFREADVTSEADLESVFAGLDLDVLVNNAAYYAPLVGDGQQRFDEIADEEWDAVMAVNAKGPFLATKAALPRFGPDGGAVVHLSSDTVTTGVPGMLHYVTSKSAIVGMTRSMATELGDLGIRVNAVMPGFTETPASRPAGDRAFEAFEAKQALDGRLQPEDIAGVVAFLAGPDSAAVTGQVVVANAGRSYY
ncbi:MAG: SDR family NAD(P)-dependent oxidoreductase [Halobacteriales archaeon]